MVVCGQQPLGSPGRHSLGPHPAAPGGPYGGWWAGGHWVGPLGDRLPRQLFKGKFYYCEGADTRNISTRAECRAAHYRWVRRKYNFDNLGQVSSARLPLPYLVPPVGGLTAFRYQQLGVIDQSPVLPTGLTL